MTLSKGRLPYSKEWRACFAWFPTYLLDGTTVWLETIYYRWDGSGYDPDFEYSRTGYDPVEPRYDLGNVIKYERKTQCLKL
jgi:hypothetical protein